jgi:hypothetical protein
MDVTWFLAATLFKLHEFEEADPLFRHVLDVRGRTRGPDDPGTLEALELLIRVLMRTDGLAEAKIMATSLVERRTKVLGQEHADTLTARELLDSIDSG